MQFAAGAVVAPHVGVAGTSAVPMGIAMVVASGSALTIHCILLRGFDGMQAVGRADR